jgi:HSP20 family protein
MMRYTPFDDLFERMSRGFGDMGMDMDMDMHSRAFDVDITDADDEVVVTADIPGFDREELDVNVTGRTLSIRASHDDETRDEGDERGGTYVRRERRSRSTARSIGLPADVDEDAASATYRNGVLTVRLPKVDVSDDARHIDVE